MEMMVVVVVERYVNGTRDRIVFLISWQMLQ